MTDSVTVVHEEESHMDNLHNTEEGDTEDRERHDDQVHGVGDLDMGLILGKLYTLSYKITGINVLVNVQEATDILLDVNTACKYIHISGDRKTASRSVNQKYPDTPGRFQYDPQVISTRRFSSGQHYWEVEVSKSFSWRVGMCYPSIDREGEQSLIGCNNKSWCLDREDDKYSVTYENKVIYLPDNIPYDRVRIYLDYEDGQLSFYSLCDRIRHLHTVTATFTEPLHAILGVWDGCIEISAGVQSTQRPVIS
ncbi:tripartite motif-containing protein 14-like [Mixophyes fleayi]|uniref:tripartite motif-containing protein 14-like n=1 Tax=Mixophyes fleayi TaxID=3061075 RepID=UPI003F4E0705